MSMKMLIGNIIYFGVMGLYCAWASKDTKYDEGKKAKGLVALILCLPLLLAVLMA